MLRMVMIRINHKCLATVHRLGVPTCINKLGAGYKILIVG